MSKVLLLNAASSLAPILRSSALFGPPWAANAPDAAPKMSTAAGLVKEPMPEKVMEVRSLEV
jgi:hypothetical protein